METAQVLLRSAGGLLAVLGTLWVCVRVVKARTGGLGASAAVRVRVLARAPLGRHASVVTVDVGDRVLVLGVGEHGVRLLAEQPALAAPEPAPAAVVAVPVPGVDPGAALAAGAEPPAVPAPRGPLAGSVIDPATWRAVVAVAREKTVRR